MIYRGRFAPSPTGPLHAGSLVAALGSWLDARAHQGQWLVRIEDVDTPRCKPAAAQYILQQLTALGLQPDAAPLYQSQRSAQYQAALDALIAAQRVYPCGCSRSAIAAALAARGRSPSRHGELVYPGTCRPAAGSSQVRSPSAWRMNALGPSVHWHDRRLGEQAQRVDDAVGDFVLRRADGLWAYQLAVVVDDAAQGITDVVRGEDLADNTARQILLQSALGLPRPRYLHLPLALADDGQKLSKQNGAEPLALQEPLAALNRAAQFLGLPAQTGTAPDCLVAWVQAWQAQWQTA